MAKFFYKTNRNNYRISLLAVKVFLLCLVSVSARVEKVSMQETLKWGNEGPENTSSNEVTDKTIVWSKNAPGVSGFEMYHGAGGPSRFFYYNFYSLDGIDYLAIRSNGDFAFKRWIPTITVKDDDFDEEGQYIKSFIVEENTSIKEAFLGVGYNWVSGSELSLGEISYVGGVRNYSLNYLPDNLGLHQETNPSRLGLETDPLFSDERKILYRIKYGYYLDVNLVGNGTVTESGNSVVGTNGYAEDSEITLVAEPDSGWAFSHWTGDYGSANPANATIAVTMDEAKTLTANFIQLHALVVTADPAVGGNITGAEEESYSHGSTVTLTAVPNDGWEFIGWIVNSSPTSGNSGNPAEITITMDGPKNVTANFSEIPEDPYALWLGLYDIDPEGANTAPGEDYDNDGLTNLMEFFIGSGPDDGVQTKLPVAELGEEGLEFTYHRNQIAVDAGYTGEVEYSETLAANSWQVVEALPVDNEDGTFTVTIAIPEGVATKLFARLKVSEPEPAGE